MGGFATYNDGGVAKTTMYADNVDFSGTRTNTVTTDGQLLIGSTTAPNLRVGTLGSGDGSITWTVGAGTITGQVTGGTTVGKTITGNTGGPISPSAGNWNLLGNNTADNGFATYITGSGSTLTANSHGVVKFVVNSTAGVGTHTTVASALAAASSGDTIWLTEMFTENVTVPAGVALRGATHSGCGITGKITQSGAGTITVSDLTLTTNGDNLFAQTGTAACTARIERCFLNIADATGISVTNTNTNSAVQIIDCIGDVAATRTQHALSSVGSGFNLVYINCNFALNGPVSTAQSTADSGRVVAYSTVFGNPLSFSGTSTGLIQQCVYAGSSLNATFITHTSSGGVNSNFNNASSGTASVYSTSGAGTLVSYHDIVSSTNASTVAGTGNFRHDALVLNTAIGTLPTFASTLTLTAAVTGFTGISVQTPSAGTAITATSTDAGATVGPILELYRNSASPATNDNIGSIQFLGKSSTGVQRLYGQISGFIDSASNGAENSTLYFFTQQAGVQTQQMRLLSTGGQYRGNNTNTTPPASYIGERLVSTVAQGAPIALTNNTPANIHTLSLTAGIWDVTLIMAFVSPTTTPTLTQARLSISATSATLSGALGDSDVVFPVGCAPVTGVSDSFLTLPTVRVELAATTSYYGVVRVLFSAGDISAYGRMSAVRVG